MRSVPDVKAVVVKVRYADSAATTAHRRREISPRRVAEAEQVRGASDSTLRHTVRPTYQSINQSNQS